MEIEVVERRKLIEVEEKEILRKEKELIAIVRRPAEAEAYRMEQIAEGNRYRETLRRGFMKVVWSSRVCSVYEQQHSVKLG